MQPVYFGTTSWAFDDWVGVFYPPETPRRAFLAAYARVLPVVEVDSSFYSIPARRVVERWARQTPAQFRFALKAPRTITHDAVLVDVDEQMQQFVDVLQPLGDKLLTLVLQFPRFRSGAFNTPEAFRARLGPFLERWRPHAPLVVEVRNRDWLTRDYFNLLREHGAGAVLCEHVELPPIDRVVREQDAPIGAFTYLRLIGDRVGMEKITTEWKREVVDRGADIERVAETIRHLAAHTPVYVLVNNHYAGHAPATIRRLQRRLGLETNERPAGTLFDL